MFLLKKPIRYACVGFVTLQLASHPAASPAAWADDPPNQADPLNQPEPPSKAATPSKPGPLFQRVPQNQPPTPDPADPLSQPGPPQQPPFPEATPDATAKPPAPPDHAPSPPPSTPSGLQSILGSDFSAADWVGAAQDLRATAEIAERLSERLADVMQSAFFHFSEASRHFDPLGMKANAETIARQHETITRQSDTIQELLKAEINRLEAENATLRRAARQNDVIQHLLKAEISQLEAADEPTDQTADEDSNR